MKQLRELVRNLVWTSVIATACGLGALVSAGLGEMAWVVAFGLCGVTSATLASRDK
jgi:hypothetical protein